MYEPLLGAARSALAATLSREIAILVSCSHGSGNPTLPARTNVTSLPVRASFYRLEVATLPGFEGLPAGARGRRGTTHQAREPVRGTKEHRRQAAPQRGGGETERYRQPANGITRSDYRSSVWGAWRPVDVSGYAWVAFAFPGCDVLSGDFACDGRRVDGATNELSPGPARTASCVALPSKSSCHVRNHTVQPSPQRPALGLPVIVTGSPKPANL
jgi:hypothetical protein